MRKTVTLWVVGTALAGLLAASPAEAVTTICVTPASVTTCPSHTITAALTLASPGAIIKVAPGTYYDNNITVPAGLDGLQIVGATKTNTILDIGSNTALAVVSGGTGIIINSRNVVVKNMMIRNGSLGVLSYAPGTIVTGMNFLGQDGLGVLLFSYNAQVTTSEFHGMSIAVLGTGFGTIVKGNLITDTTTGVILVGDQGQVQLNKVYNSVIGIEVAADGAQVKSNDVRYQTLGILTVGAFPTVQLNKVFASQMGIESVCSTCFGGSVASNLVTDATLYGILVSSDAPGLFVQNNSVLRAGTGIVVSNTAGGGDRAVFLLTNKAADIGNDMLALDPSSSKGHCYSITGDSNVAYKNQAKGCSSSGIYATGNNNTLDSNVAAGTFENGFTVDGAAVPYSGNYLTTNKATGNTGEGIAIIGNASGTTVQFNSATLNRTNFCDRNYNGTVLVSNSFADPGGVVACDIVH
jgi:hypothetical protein